ncbi:hypothetical protein I8752_31280 [Nostocaceae cyanobacterium CENA369]|uniref:Uncharacterized protein n=1 Tax=Dendronalium phyllosphericum CENA369 TaxID=1725256 RepID=A0A8J7ID89_9NOST|nr:hypothetical protein [Dendronalium phyllosphericum]MBH8577373.1 hypothetical protein [Dendronalium phyllosphericum CENA369]
MTLWKKLRILLLAVTLGSVVLVFVKVSLTKNTNKPKALKFGREANIVELFEDDVCIVSRYEGNYDVVFASKSKSRQTEITEESHV